MEPQRLLPPLTWNSRGWFVEHLEINGQCDSVGKPFLYTNFDHDDISYPSDLAYFLEQLWTQIRDEQIDQGEAQVRLQQLADWVTTTEQNAPQW